MLVKIFLPAMITAWWSSVSLWPLCHSLTLMPLIACNAWASNRHCMLTMNCIWTLMHSYYLSSFDQMLVCFDFFSCQSKLLFQSFDAIMRLSFLSVFVNFLIALFTYFGSLRALILEMKFEILWFQTKSASLWTLNKSIATARYSMLNGCFISAYILASLIWTFEFEIMEILLDKPMNLSELNCFVSLAFFWARLIFFSPRSNAMGTKHRLTAWALCRIQHHHSANWTDEEVSSLP